MRRIAVMSLPLVLILRCLALSATVQVGGCLTGVRNFTNIQSAVNASVSGGTVKVWPGTIHEVVQ
jgi:hypothetical protein